jgi:predicted permease
MSDIQQEIRHAARQLRLHPGFTVAAVLCIALGIGANTATFSIADAFLFKTADVSAPDQLVRLYINWSSGLKHASFSYPDYADLRDDNDVFTGLVAEAIRPFHLSTGERNEKIWGSIVSGNYFSELGIKLAKGRGFLPEEDQTPGTHPVAVLSYGLWQSRFAAADDIIGKEILINNHKVTVVGITKEGFLGTNSGIGTAIWVPMMMQEQLVPGSNLLESRGNHWISPVIGRLKPGVTIEQADASVNRYMAGLIELYPDTNTGTSVAMFVEAESGLHPVVRSGFVGFLTLMFAVVGFILLLACANVAGLLVARLASRYKEIGVRLALGASRGQLVRQLFAESLLLCLLGGVCGLGIGLLLIRLVGSFTPPSEFPLALNLSLDLRVLTFTLLASLVTGVLFGLAPAYTTARQELALALREGASSLGGQSSKLRKLLVIGQVALSLMLLVGAGLAVRSLDSTRKLDLGCNPDNMLVASIDLGLQGYDEAQGRQLKQSLREQVGRLPGVEAASWANVIPLNFTSQQTSAIPEGFVIPEGQNEPSIDFNIVDEGYFQAMGIPILRGRAITEQDDTEAPPVLVINQAFADRFWPGEDPIGKLVRRGDQDHEVVGLVKTGKYFSIGEDPKPYMYRSGHRDYRGALVLHVRTEGDPSGYFSSVRSQVRGLDLTLPVSELRTMSSAMDMALLPSRMAAGVVSAFALLALLLAAIGLYGVIAYSVSRSTREIGIRIAIGARSFDVQWLVLRRGMLLTVVGLATGLIGGLLLTNMMARVLYGVSAVDPLAYLSGIILLTLVAFVAILLPAHRATRISPVVALREE